MPELPEVETTIRKIKPHLQNQEITQVYWGKHASSILNVDLATAHTQLVGNKLTQLERRGKFMLYTFANDLRIVGHLRMTGRFAVLSELPENTHLHFALQNAKSEWIAYIDPRRFGTWHFVPDFKQYQGLKLLGPDAWLDELNADYIAQKLAKIKTRSIYSALLDQTLLAGLGNIYVNEALFATRISPLRPANQVTKPEVTQLIINIKNILEQAIAMSGTTLIDKMYQDPGGKYGQFAKLLKVYGRKNQTCYVCDNALQQIQIAGRTVTYCPHCQR